MAFIHKISKALRSLFNKCRPTTPTRISPTPLFLIIKLQEPAFPAVVVVPITAKMCAPKMNLHDHELQYTTVKTRELLRSLTSVFPMAVGPAVDLEMVVMRSEAVEENWAATTVYQPFCAGENAEEAAQTLHRLCNGGLRGILDYGTQDPADGAACDRNLAGIPSTVEMTATQPPFFVSLSKGALYGNDLRKNPKNMSTFTGNSFKGLESLVRHFAGCKNGVLGGCPHCNRMWQLFKLHSWLSPELV